MLHSQAQQDAISEYIVGLCSRTVRATVNALHEERCGDYLAAMEYWYEAWSTAVDARRFLRARHIECQDAVAEPHHSERFAQ